MSSTSIMLQLVPCNDFDIIVWFDSSWASFVPISVILSFPIELGVPDKRSNVILKPRDRDKELFMRFHINKGIPFTIPMSLGVITVKSDEDILAWESLPKAVLAGEGVRGHIYLGIRVKLADAVTLDYRLDDD